MKKFIERIANDQKSKTQLEGLRYWLDYYVGSPPDPEKFPNLTLEMLHEFMDESRNERK